MRIMMIVRIPVEEGNRAAKAGKLGSTIQSILSEQKPEAAYFTALEGQRTGILILNMQDNADVPKLAEPWFLAFNAAIEMHLAMVPADLAKAAPAIEQAVKKFG